MFPKAIQRSSFATLCGVVPHYFCFYLFGWPLLTESIAEWIMARTPSRYAVPLLATLGPWAKPFALTGALAALGFALFLACVAAGRSRSLAGLFVVPAAFGIGWLFGYANIPGSLSFWLPAAIALTCRPPAPASLPRRAFLASILPSGVAAVALESYFRNAALARTAVQPVALFPFHPPATGFGAGLVRKAVTPAPEFYGMSKNAVDPSVDPTRWRLRVTADGRTLREITYAELLALPRTDRYATLRCVSNTLQSDLMGTALWSGVFLSQIAGGLAPSSAVEAAIFGADGHSDSVPVDYAFCDETMLVLGMNGKTLSRTHGFPLRLLAPRYYGFKNVKWISEIRFVRRPFYGTWPKLGYTKEPLIHTASHIDRVVRDGATLRVGGVSFAGVRGIREVDLRAGSGPWFKAVLEPPLSPFTWTRWRGELPTNGASLVEARALDGAGRWQESVEGPLFPDGVTGPTIRRIAP